MGPWPSHHTSSHTGGVLGWYGEVDRASEERLHTAATRNGILERGGSCEASSEEVAFWLGPGSRDQERERESRKAPGKFVGTSGPARLKGRISANAKNRVQ